MNKIHGLLGLVLFLGLPAIAHSSPSAAGFLKTVESELLLEAEHEQRVEWVQQNFITEDTTRLTADASAKLNELSTRYAIRSKSYSGSTPDEKRKLLLLLNGLTIPAPKNPKKNAEMSQLLSELESAYGSAKVCDSKQTCRDLQDLEEVLKTSRDPNELLQAWEGWHATAKSSKQKYARIVELGNQGARELGFKNLADVWMSKYDLSSRDYEKSIDRLWVSVKPLYEQLHCYVRSQLNRQYGDSVVPKTGPIPAHVLGNMWAQQWPNIHDLTDIEASRSVDLTELLKASQMDAKKMVETGEAFYVSLGLPKLPKSFYERSLFEKPRDREVVCHASAWDIDSKSDVRIKMCIKPDEESFRTIHHELGHIYYDLAYQNQPFLFQGGANDGFHEGLGDAIQLSLTNDYLKKIQLLKSGKQSESGPDIDYLFKMALEKVAFLPFGLLVDKWRWQVFTGQVQPADYNQAWWKLRQEYQGVKAPNSRDPDAFDPGAKYHVASFTPYSRYFLAHILQFQFHRALCRAAGNEGPLAECSIYGSKAAGARLESMMKLGMSKPWQEALQAMTGESEMDSSAIRDYFSPLETWLKKKNEGQKCGW